MISQHECSEGKLADQNGEMKTDREPKQFASFWMGPLLAGIGLATGYETTQRIMIVNSNIKEPAIELFQIPKSLPGTVGEGLSQFDTNTETKSFSDVNPGQSKKMESMLNALEIRSIDSKTTKQRRSSNQINNQKFRISKKTRKLQQQIFHKLFQSLPAP